MRRVRGNSARLIGWIAVTFVVAGCGAASPTAPPASASVTATGPAAATQPAYAPLPTRFSTAGALIDWTGFQWSELPAGSPLIGAALDHRVAFGDSLSKGYAMVQTIDGGSSRAWTSGDGTVWVPGPSGIRVIVFWAPGIELLVTRQASDTYKPRLWPYVDGGGDWMMGGTMDRLEEITSIGGADHGMAAISRSPSGVLGLFWSQHGDAWVPGEADLGTGTPIVTSVKGHIFLMTTTASGGRLARSDDGAKWTQALELNGTAGYRIDEAADGLLLRARDASTGTESLYSSVDEGTTWRAETGFGPLGSAAAGSLSANGSLFLAVKADGSAAWTSKDGRTWKPIGWGQPSGKDVVVLPHGVVLNLNGRYLYGAAQSPWSS